MFEALRDAAEDTRRLCSPRILVKKEPASMSAVPSETPVLLLLFLHVRCSVSLASTKRGGLTVHTLPEPSRAHFPSTGRLYFTIQNFAWIRSHAAVMISECRQQVAVTAPQLSQELGGKGYLTQGIKCKRNTSRVSPAGTVSLGHCASCNGYTYDVTTTTSLVLTYCRKLGTTIGATSALQSC